MPGIHWASGVKSLCWLQVLGFRCSGCLESYVHGLFVGLGFRGG